MAATPDPLPRGPASFRRWLGVFVTLALMMTAAGCSYVLPSRPYSPDYVVNRDGHYFIGDRCSTSLTQVGVFLVDPARDSSGSIDFSTAIWHAVSLPTVVREFQLFASDQPGVSVVSDDGIRPSSGSVFIYLKNDSGHIGRLQVILDQVGDRQVASGHGLLSWADYMAASNRSYAC